MKKLSYFITLICLISLSSGINAQSTNNDGESSVKETNKVKVYYFHNTRRCATCNAVEEVTLETLKESYPDQFASGEITFESLNLEEDEGENIARKLNLSGQTLLLVINGKKKDLTNEAFMYAKSSPDKLKKKINKVVGSLYN